ncbi:hypothetical protein AALC17_01515 [Oscillospiraceae bacterium 38-13]
MANDTLKTFPSTEIEALAYLYVQSQDLSGKSPAEIHTMYQEAYWEIKRDNTLKDRSGWLMKKKEEARQP